MKVAPIDSETEPRRLIHFTPLRYPGGKGKLAGFIKEVLEENELLDGIYAEPYAGGAAIGLELLFHEYVSHIYINDYSKPVYAFWKCVLDHTESLVKLVRDTPITVKAWDRQKRILSHAGEHDALTLGFATFFLNRTNLSGILGGGIIGGRDQSGPWKIDARFNKQELIFRIESIARQRRRISVSNEDAVEFLSKRLKSFPDKTLIYLDPPYYGKGKELYLNYYNEEDHKRIAQFVTGRIQNQKWVVSYDNVKAIRGLYPGCRRIIYGIGYSARDTREGVEVMIFSNDLHIPAQTDAMRVLG